LPSLDIHTPLLFQVELKKKTVVSIDGVSECVEYRWTCFGVRVPKTLYYPTMNLNSC